MEDSGSTLVGRGRNVQGYGREKLGFETISVKVTAGTQLELENYDDHFFFGLFWCTLCVYAFV